MSASDMALRFRRTGIAVAVSAVTAAAVVGCGGSDGDATSSGSSGSSGGGKTVKVGNITSVAGQGGTFSGFQAGVKAFFSYYNDNGGLDGTKVELTAIDDAADPGKNTAAARKLVQETKVLAIVGEASSADAASQKYLQSAGVPVIGGWAASSVWQRPATNMFASLQGPNTPFCSGYANTVAKEAGGKRFAVIATDYPSAIQDGKCRTMYAEKLGMTPALDQQNVSLTATDYRPAVQQAMKAGADTLIFSTGIDGVVKGAQAGEQLGFKGNYIAVTQFPATIIDSLGPIAKSVSGRLYSSTFALLVNDPPSLNAELAKFLEGMKKYQPKFAEDSSSVSGWAAGAMFADALKAVGPDQEKLLEYMKGLKDYDFRGLQGKMSYVNGSEPNPCTTSVVFKDSEIVRTAEAPKAPAFSCSEVINTKTGAATR